MVLPAGPMGGSGDSGRERESQADEERGDGELDGIGVAGGDEVKDRIIEADGAAEVAMEDVAPVVEVLDVQRLIEAELMADCGEVCSCGSFA